MKFPTHSLSGATMNQQYLVSLVSFEMFFRHADEAKLKNICNTFNSRCTFDVESRSVLFTLSKPQIHQLESLHKVMEIVDELGRIHAQVDNCYYDFANLNFYPIDHKESEKLLAKNSSQNKSGVVHA